MDETVILDACCTLCLSATGRMDEILSRLPYSFVTGARALRESLYLEIPGSDEREAVDLQPLVERGLLRELQLVDEAELALFVQFASRVKDGEAEAAALAVHCGYVLATDDRKARRVVSEAYPSVRLTSTPELLREWQQLTAPTDADMADVVRRVWERATFRPRRLDPLYPWWSASLGEE